MSTATATSHDEHLAEESKKYFTFFNLSLVLIAITAIELVIIYIPIHTFLIYASLVILSLFKFAAVIWWFMHLRWDKLLCTVLFLIGLLMAGGTAVALLLLFSPDAGGSMSFDRLPS